MRQVILFTFALLCAQRAVACQCGRLPSPNEAKAKAFAVFEGTLLDKRVILGSSSGWAFPVEEYEFAVTRAWKGVSTSKVVLLGGYGNCASIFAGDTAYLVYATFHGEEPSRLSSSKCLPTKRVATAAADLVDLGPALIELSPRRARRSSLGSRHLIRVYFVAGAAAYINLVRHGNHASTVWWIGSFPVLIAGLAAAFVIAGVLLVRKCRRLAILLFCLSLATAALAIPIAGHMVLRLPYFAHFLS